VETPALLVTLFLETLAIHATLHALPVMPLKQVIVLPAQQGTFLKMGIASHHQ